MDEGRKAWVGGEDTKEYRKAQKKSLKMSEKLGVIMNAGSSKMSRLPDENKKQNKKRDIDSSSNSSKLENIMQSIQDEAPHALAVSAGAVAGLYLAPMSPIAIPTWAAAASGVGLGCAAYQMSQGAGLSDLVIYKQSIAAAIGAAASTSFGLVDNAMLNTVLFTFVADQAGNYFMN